MYRAALPGRRRLRGSRTVEDDLLSLGQGRRHRLETRRGHRALQPAFATSCVVLVGADQKSLSARHVLACSFDVDSMAAAMVPPRVVGHQRANTKLGDRSCAPSSNVGELMVLTIAMPRHDTGVVGAQPAWVARSQSGSPNEEHPARYNPAIAARKSPTQQQRLHRGSDGQTHRATTGSGRNVVSTQDRRTEDACA
jgi:hypothetical protein